MAVITSANLANAIVKLVAVDALPALMGNLVMGNLVNRDFEPTLAQAGDTVNVPIPPTLVANNIAEGGSVVTQNPNVGNASIVLNTHAEATFQIPDVTKVLAVPDLLKLYMQPAVIALAEKIETDLLNLYSQFTANAGCGHRWIGADRSGDRYRRDGAVQRKGSGERAEVPGRRWRCLFAAASDSALQRVPERRRRGSARSGRRQRRQDQGLLRVPFAVRSEDRHDAGHDAEHCVLAECDRPGDSPSAATSCRVPAPSPSTPRWATSVFACLMSYAPNTLAQQFTVDVLYGAAVLRNNHGVQVRS